jgi:hypothetical protein
MTPKVTSESKGRVEFSRLQIRASRLAAILAGAIFVLADLKWTLTFHLYLLGAVLGQHGAQPNVSCRSGRTLSKWRFATSTMVLAVSPVSIEAAVATGQDPSRTGRRLRALCRFLDEG